MAENIAPQLETMIVPIDSLSLDDANARKHSERNLDAIARSLHRFGQRSPIVVQKSGMIVRAGNGRLLAAKSLGWKNIAALVVDEESIDATAFAIADNRTAELAEWDDETLAALLNGLPDDLLADSGFTDDELQGLIDGLTDPPEIVEDEAPEPPADPVTRKGDLWTLGKHRLLCGDSTSEGDVSRLFGGAKADLCFTSPPYAQQRDYTEESRQHTADWDALMRGVFGNLPMSDKGQVLVNLGLIHRDGEWVPYWDGWIAWMREQGWKRFGWYVWDQGCGLPGDWNGRLAPSHEFVFHFNKQASKTIKSVLKDPKSGPMGSDMRSKDGENGKHSSVCGDAKKVHDSVIRANRNSAHGTGHPATFSLSFASESVACFPGLVYDPFLGSGTTIIAAEQLGRVCYGMEISPAYVDVAVRRWQKLTGETATREDAEGNAAEGMPVAELEAV